MDVELGKTRANWSPEAQAPDDGLKPVSLLIASDPGMGVLQKLGTSSRN